MLAATTGRLKPQKKSSLLGVARTVAAAANAVPYALHSLAPKACGNISATNILNSKMLVNTAKP